MNAAIQLSHDRGYIGGANVAGIMGISPFRTPLDEYLTITGQAPDTEETQQRFFARRKALEPFAEEVLQQVTGLSIIRHNVRYRDDHHDYMRAEIDFETADGGNGEIKTVHPMAAASWGDPSESEPPPYVTAQAMHGMGIKGSRFCRVMGLVGFDDARIYLVERDDELVDLIRTRMQAFWNQHVLKGRPPQPVSREDLLYFYSRDTGAATEATPEVAEAMAELREIKGQSKRLDDRGDVLKLQIQQHMKSATTLLIDGKPAASWKHQETRRLDSKALEIQHPDIVEAFRKTTETRVFRVK